MKKKLSVKKDSSPKRTKLALKKDTLRTLADGELAQVAGGWSEDICVVITKTACGGGCGY